MATVTSSLAACLDRHLARLSSSSSSSSGDTSDEESSSTSGWSSSSSTSSSSSSSSSSTKKKSKKKSAKKSDKSKSKSARKIKAKSAHRSVENGSDDVSNMLLLGAELLKEVEEVASMAAAATAESDDVKSSQQLLPIGHYVVHGGADRSALLEQVLSSVPAAQLQAILPPVLKEMNGVELKQLCLQQLQLLSDATILNIINGGSDQGPTSKTSTVTGHEAANDDDDVDNKKKKSKKNKKDKKKSSKKNKKKDRSGGGGEDGTEQRVGGEEDEEESSGKTLMELLELEMRARAIKALLKKEEEGDDGDDKADDWATAILAGRKSDVVQQQRPFKSEPIDSGDKQPHKQQSIGHGHHHHRPADPALSVSATAQTKPHSAAALQHRSVSSVAVDREQRRHPSSSSSSSHRYDDARGDSFAFHPSSQQPRHYRHHHRHHHRDDQDHDRSRSGPRRPSAVQQPAGQAAAATIQPAGQLAVQQPEARKKSPPSSPIDRRPSPFLSTPSKEDDDDVEEEIERKPTVVVQTSRVKEEPLADTRPASTIAQREDDVEYEEEGIQEVDIELGSGSDDDAHSARL